MAFSKISVFRTFLINLALVVFTLSLSPVNFAIDISAATTTDFGLCISNEEAKLGNLINNHRKAIGLPTVPIAQVLTRTAQAHVYDLQTNNPATGSCNLHSWSNAFLPQVSSVCYTNDHAKATEMWNKPRQFSEGSYSGNGYEIAAMSYGGINAQKAFDIWMNSPAHRAVIEETGVWENSNWPGIGVGISGNYAVVWFGDAASAAGPEVCKNEAAVKNQIVYRFRYKTLGSYLYTVSTSERDNIINTLSSKYDYEGAKFTVINKEFSENNTVEVFRFFNKLNGGHFYTSSTVEKNSVMKNPDFILEGVVFKAFDKNTGSLKPVYRFFNTQNNSHLYTASETERQNILNNLKHFRSEGIAYYVY